MATTTTNFGWDIPQSTDLVKDGATAIATLGQDIDTALVDLKGGTTGQVLSKNSGTDLDFTWVAQDDSNAIQNAIVDAKGDLITATAADTPARLAVGSNDQVLMADSTTATGLKWGSVSGGGMTLLSTTTLSGSSTSVSITATGYTALAVHMYGVQLSSGGDGVSISINNSGNALLMTARGEGGGTPSLYMYNNSSFGMNNGTDLDNTTNNASWINIYNPTSTTNWKPIDIRSGWINNAGQNCSYLGGGVFKSNSEVTSIMFDQFGSPTFSAGTVKVYGVK